MRLASFSDDGSRMWIDLDGNGQFAPASPELLNNHWGSGQGWTFGENSGVVPPGVYRFRAQYEEGIGGNAIMVNGAFPRLSPPIVHYVNVGNATPYPPYTDWFTAAVTIQDAIDVSEAGDEIVVTNGVYRTGGRVVYGSMANRVALTAAVTVRSVNGPRAGHSHCGYGDDWRRGGSLCVCGK